MKRFVKCFNKKLRKGLYILLGCFTQVSCQLGGARATFLLGNVFFYLVKRFYNSYNSLKIKHLAHHVKYFYRHVTFFYLTLT